MTILRKLSSRKLWIAVVGVIVGVAATFGIETNEWAQIAGVITSAASIIAYIFGEAKIDAASVAKETKISEEKNIENDKSGLTE